METIRPENKRNKFVFFTIIILYSLVHLYIALSPRSSMMNWFRIDDAFYYFQVARNILTGQGVSFDGINPGNGFHPLWMLLILPVFAISGGLDFVPLRIIILLSAGITLGSGYLLYQMIKQQLSSLSALLLLSVWLFGWQIHSVITQSGMEAAINAFFIILLLYLVNKADMNKPTQVLLLGLVGALTLLSRLDNIFFVLLIGAWIVFRQRPMRYLILVDIFSVFFSVFISLFLRLGPSESLQYLSPATMLVVFGLIFRLLSFYVFGLYNHPRDYSPLQLLTRFAAAIFTAAVPTIGLMVLGMAQGWLETLPRLILILDLVLFIILSGFSRFLFWGINPQDSSEQSINIKIRWRQWFSTGGLYLLPIVLLFGGYLLWNLGNFGTPMPVSGQIKQWWGTLPNTVYGKHQESLLTVLGLHPEFNQIDPWWIVKDIVFDPILTIFGNISVEIKLLVSAVLFFLYAWLLILLVQTQKNLVKHSLIVFSFPPLLTASLLQPFYLSVTGYLHARSWYWVMQIILVTLGLAILVEIILRWFNTNQIRRKWAPGLITFLILVVILGNSVPFIRTYPPKENPENLEQFTGMSAFLEKHTEPGTIIGMTGGGLEAYFTQQRTIVNMDGLINSYAYFQMMKAGEAELYLDHIGMEYVFGSPIMLLESDPYWWFFTDRIEPIQEYVDGKVLYRYLNTGVDVSP